jgi:cobalamin biosynthesis protein CobW
VKLVAARDGAVPPEVALGLAATAEDDLAARPSVHDLEMTHDHDDFESFVLSLGAVADSEAFFARLRAVIRQYGVLRLKGFVDLPGRDRRLVVQAVGDRLQQYFDRPWQGAEQRETRLVVIGEKGLARTAIAAALAG